MIFFFLFWAGLINQIQATPDSIIERMPDRALPPLESFFSASRWHSESLSPDGDQISYFFTTETGATSLHLIDVNELLATHRISPANHGNVVASCWITEHLLYYAMQSADQTNRFFLYDTDSHVTKTVLTEKQKHVRLTGVISGDAPCLLVEITESARSSSDLYQIPLRGDHSPKLIYKNIEKISSWAWDGKGKPMMGISWDEKGVKKIHDLTHSPSKVILQACPKDDLRLLFASFCGRYAYLLTNIDADLTYVAQLDRETGKLKRMSRDPIAEVDIEQIFIHESKRQIIAVSYLGASHRFQVVSSKYRPILEKMTKCMTHEKFSILGINHDRSLVLLKTCSADGRDETLLYDVKNDCMKPLSFATPERKNGVCSKTSAISYPAQDGCLIPAYFTIPQNSKPPWPLIVFPHGGPRARTRPGYDGRVLFLASRGYAVLQPNFRGSRGYGKKFMNAGDRQWGKGVMQSDVTDGVDYLISTQQIDSKRIAIMGGSYGGYSALAGMVFTPSRYAAGISLFGISDLMAYSNEFPKDFLSYAGDAVRRLGDVTSDQGRKDLVDRSPSHHPDRFQAPVLLYHGLNDKILPVTQSSKIADALTQKQKPLEFLLSHEEGHGFQRPISEMAVYRAIEIFLHQHLGGLLGPVANNDVEQLLKTFRENGKSACLNSSQ